MTDNALHLAVALDGAGWHPAAWREPAARPHELFSPRYWTDLVRRAEEGLLDLVTIEDSFSPQSTSWGELDDRTDQVRGRLDAVLIASRVAPLTSHIGLVPTAVVTHTEPFHVSKAIATLDYVSSGRAGVRLQVSTHARDAAHVGRRDVPLVSVTNRDDPAVQALIGELFAEATDYAEVLRRLWDSWEDDAEIRDAATGRFVDRAKLHYIDFEGGQFSVKGPSITPRPPQGQPLISVLAHQTVPYRLGATSADLVYVTPHSTADAATILAEVRGEQDRAGRAEETVHVFGELVVVLGDSADAARARLAHLDEVAGTTYRSDAEIFTGTPAELADLLQDRAGAGLSGFRLRPAALPDDLDRIVSGLVPELQRRGVFRTSYEASTLRGLLGLGRPANRYTASV